MSVQSWIAEIYWPNSSSLESQDTHDQSFQSQRTKNCQLSVTSVKQIKKKKKKERLRCHIYHKERHKECRWGTVEKEKRKADRKNKMKADWKNDQGQLGQGTHFIFHSSHMLTAWNDKHYIWSEWVVEILATRTWCMWRCWG